MIPEPWAHLPFFDQNWPVIDALLGREGHTVLPDRPHWFRALSLVPPDRVRVVLLGQDPYPTPGHAVGLAFSVGPATSPLPRSLANIFKELRSDLGAAPANGDLTHWAEQGVLLLNTSLTVPAGQAGGHAGLGWSELARQMLDEVSRRPTAFLLWGGHAQAMRPAIRPGDHLLVESSHPSPLSAHRGFFGSRPFGRVNSWLTGRGEAAIRWA
jgi:uracil-DNA glycosylase